MEGDPRLKQGKEFMKEKKYEDAIDIFCALVEHWFR
jgi:hypothetical protein